MDIPPDKKRDYFYYCIMSEQEDKHLISFSRSLPEIIGFVGLIAFLLVIGVYGITGGTHGNSGTIGDTVGGIAGPIIGLLSAVLIFYSFKAQIRANEITREQSLKAIQHAREESNFRYLIEEFERVKKTIENHTCPMQQKDIMDKNNKKGIDALEYFSVHLKYIEDEEDGAKLSLFKTKYLLLDIENMLREQELPLSKDFKGILNSKMTRYYNEKLYVTLINITYWDVKSNVSKPTGTQILLSEVKAGATRIVGLFSEIET